MVQTILLVSHVAVAVALIVLVLLQQGKGADAGAAFGSGASATVFGARGSATFLSRATGVLAALFFMISLGLAYLFSGERTAESVAERIEQTAPVDETPAAPVAPSAPVDVPQLPSSNEGQD